MSRKQTTLMVVVALFAGFLGGVVSQQVGLTVLAQAGPADKIEAQEFRLVDAKGNLLGLIKATPTSMPAGDLVPGTKDPGMELQGLTANAGGGAIMLFDSQGQPTWAAPGATGSAARALPLR